MKIGCVLAGNGWTRWTGMDVADRVRRVPPRRDGCIARGMGTNNSRKRQRSLDKSRNPAGSRRMTGLGMTEGEKPIDDESYCGVGRGTH